MSTQAESSEVLSRHGGAAWTAAWGVGYQVATALAQFIALGFLIRLVGREQFGLWTVIYAVTTWAPLLALGQANVIMTQLGRTNFGNPGEARRVLSCGLAVSSSLAATALVLLFVLVPLVPWDSWLIVSDPESLAQAMPTAVVSIGMAIVAVPVSLSGVALIACRRGVLSYKIMILAQWLGLLVILVGIAARWPLWLLGATIIAPLVGASAAHWVVGIRRGLIIRPSVSSVDTHGVKTAVALGTTVLLFDIASIFLQRTPELIVAQLRGLADVAAFGAVNRLTLFLLAILQAILIPAWPMISEASGRNDWGLVKRALLSSLSAILLAWAIGALAIWFGGPIFIEKWTGIPDLVDNALFIAVIVQALSLGLQSWVFMALSSMLLYRRQLMAVSGAAIAYAVLAPIFGRPWGAAGVVLAQSIALILIPVPLGVHAIVRHIRARDIK